MGEPLKIWDEPLSFEGSVSASTFLYLHVKDDDKPPPTFDCYGADTFTWFEVADDEGVIVRVDEDFEVEWVGSKERFRNALLRWYARRVPKP